MTLTPPIEQYIAMQDRISWRRALLRGLIRSVGFNLLCKVEVTGKEHLPADGPTIIMMNHISAIDPIVCMGVIHSRYVIPMTKVENTHNPILRFLVWWWGSYTVDREAVDRSALTNSIELLKSGQMILIAPEGTRHPEGLAEAKDGLAYVAVKAGATIVPTTLTGTQDFKQRWKRGRRAYAKVTFGRPFRFDAAPTDRLNKTHRQQMTREAMYQLALTQPDPNLRGVFSDVEQATTETLTFS